VISLVRELQFGSSGFVVLKGAFSKDEIYSANETLYKVLQNREQREVFKKLLFAILNYQKYQFKNFNIQIALN